MTRLPALAFGAGLVGVLLGLLFPGADDVRATPDEYYVRVHPAASSTLNCGFHTACLGSPNWGTGLDWEQNSGSHSVYYRSYSQNTGGWSIAGKARITVITSGTCSSAYASLYDRADAHQGTVRYQHTASTYNGTWFWVPSNYPENYSETGKQQQVGTTKQDEDQTACTTGGPHLHQMIYDGSNYWQNEAYYPTMSECSDDCGVKEIFDYYQMGYYWTY